MDGSKLDFLPYAPEYFSSCLELFDANCPQFFALNEREEYCEFLHDSATNYFVGLYQETPIAAFGLTFDESGVSARLNWIMVASEFQGHGVGKIIMTQVKSLVSQKRINTINIAASHLSAPFFTRFGAREVKRTQHGWGRNMHRVDMVLTY